MATASAVLAFYVIEIINHHGSRALGMPSVVGRDMHAMVTALVGSWVGAALLTVVVMRLRYFPIWLKYLTTSIDLAMMTAMIDQFNVHAANERTRRAFRRARFARRMTVKMDPLPCSSRRSLLRLTIRTIR